MRRIFRSIFIAVFLLSAAVAQEPPNATAAVSGKQDFKVMPAYQPRPFRPLHFLYAINEHPKRTQIVWMIGAGVIGGTVAWKFRAHCDHYEYGQSGVNVNCPKDIQAGIAQR